MAFYPLFYHIVSDEKADHLRHLFPIKSWNEFEHDVDFLVSKFQSIQIETLLHWPNVPRNSFLLTFDDGTKELLEVARYLAERNIQAVFFVNPDFIDGKAVFAKHRASAMISALEREGRLTPEIKGALSSNRISNEWLKAYAMKNNFALPKLSPTSIYLTIDDLHEMASLGHVIGAHSCFHPHFRTIAADEQVRQTIESCRWVRNHFESQPCLFAFPFEDYFLPQKFYHEIQSSKYAPVLTFGTSDGKVDIVSNSIQRIDGEYLGWPIERILKRYRLRRMLRVMLRRNNIVRPHHAE